MYVDLAFTNHAELTAAVVGEPCFNYGKGESWQLQWQLCTHCSAEGLSWVFWWLLCQARPFSSGLTGSSVEPHSWSPSPSEIRAARQCQPGACRCLCCPLGASPLVVASQLWQQKCPEMSPHFAVLFPCVYPVQYDVFISLAVPAKQFVRWLIWLMLHKLRKFSLSLILK